MSDWHDRALCAQVDPELWYPEKGESSGAAKRICGRCPVQADCLDYAVATDQQHGVWGGLTRDQRRKLRTERELTLQAERAHGHQHTITALPAPEAAAELGVSLRTVQRWRSALRGAA